MAVIMFEDLVVPEGASRTFAQNTDNEIAAALQMGDYGLVGEIYYEPSIVNHGEIHLSDPDHLNSGTLFYFTSSLNWNYGVVENYGLISAVLPDALTVTALAAPDGSPNIFNAGTIEAQARWWVHDYSTSDGKAVVTNTKSGMITALAAETATGLFFMNGGTVVNDGQILVHATGGNGAGLQSAEGIAFGSGGGSFFATSVSNSGLIDVRDEDPANLYAVAIWYYGNGIGTVTNSGTIRGSDYAIREQSEDSYGYPSGITLENSGLIEGRVALDAGDDVIDNRGRIVGDVSLGRGDDIFYSPAGQLQGSVSGGDGSDVLFGSAGADRLNGDGGADLIRGGGGADRLDGGAGADIFVYDRIDDSTAAAFDTIAGFASGVDRIDLSALSVQSVSIQAGTDFTTLSAVTPGGSLVVHVEGTLTQADLILSSASLLTGTANADMLHAGIGGSTLSGGEGVDMLIGDVGNDRLDGGGATDVMWGGPGDDTYAVDTPYDTILELDGQGHDTVEVRFTGRYDLPRNVEDVVVAFSDSPDGQRVAVHGNDLGNRMTSNGAPDSLFGGGGNDTLIGNGGIDTLEGDTGQDRLTGGSGGDIFVFTSLADSSLESHRSDGAKSQPDVILDFQPGQDTIDLSAIDAVAGTAANDAFTYIGGAAFGHHAGELRAESRDGWFHIYADVNGDGIADMHIVVAAPTIQASDFVL
jgi:Ca2+-binding RTX toxin-like protein